MRQVGRAMHVFAVSLALGAGPAAAQTVIRPRVLVMVDTSGSMTEHFTDNLSTGGDGSTLFTDGVMTRSASATPGGLGLYEGYQLGTVACPPPTTQQYDGVHSRLFNAKAALRNVLNASGDIDWGLMCYSGTQCPVVNTSSFPKNPRTCTTDYDCRDVNVNVGFFTVPTLPFCIGGKCGFDNNLCYLSLDYGRTDNGSGACADSNPDPEGAGNTGVYFYVPYGGSCGTGSAAGSAACASPQTCFADGDCTGGAAGQCALVGAGPVRSCTCTGNAQCPTGWTCTAGRCAYNLGCQNPGGTILVDPVAANSAAIFPYIDGVEDYHDNGSGAPTNPELRAVGGTPLAGAARSAAAWYTAIKTANSDAKILCRPYVLVQMTDGFDDCDADTANGPVAGAQTFVAATAPGAKNLNKVYVIGLAFGTNPSPNLDAIAHAGGTGSARLANSQQDIEAALADIVSSSVLIEKCNHVDDDCDGVCDEPYPDVAQPDTCNVPLTDPHSDGKGGRNAVACNNGALAGTHCYASGVYVCSADQLSEACNAQTCAQNSALCPTAESAGGCNGVDDDCNGVVDDCTPFVANSCCASKCPPCAAGGPFPETCNGCDDDCDGVVDDHLVDTGRGCGSSVGQCRLGTTYCCQEANPSSTMCTQSQLAPPGVNPDRLVCLGGTNPAPIACNGCDNNCDGQVDAPAQSCYSGPAGTAGVGVCRAGTQTCNATICPQAASWGACTGQVLPSAEVCNGL